MLPCPAERMKRSAYMLDFNRFPHQRAFVESHYLPLSIATRSANQKDRTGRGVEAPDLDGWLNKEVWKEDDAKGGNRIINQREDSVNDYGSGVTGFLGLSAMIFKHYNYSNNTALMRNSKSFGLFLDHARQRALLRSAQLRTKLAEAARVKPGEVILPAAIALNVDLADTLRYGDSDDMLSSFQVYWRSTMLCDLGLQMLEHAQK